MVVGFVGVVADVDRYVVIKYVSKGALRTCAWYISTH